MLNKDMTKEIAKEDASKFLICSMITINNHVHFYTTGLSTKLWKPHWKWPLPCGKRPQVGLEENGLGLQCGSFAAWACKGNLLRTAA